MNLTTITAMLVKAKSVADGVFAVSSLIVVPVLFTVPLVWLLEKPGSVRAAHGDSAPLVVSAYRDKHSQSPSVLVNGLEFSWTPRRTVYHMELVDTTGNVVLTYPKVETREEPRFDNIILQVPSSIKAGTYQLVAQVSAAVNPIKSTEATVVVASIDVD